MSGDGAGCDQRLDALCHEVKTRLQYAGVDDAPREARRLISALLGVTPEAYLGHPEQFIAADACARVLRGAAQRCAGMPVGRIAGRQKFYGRTFMLGPAILEPRADSEVLVDAALEILGGEGDWKPPLRIIDVGTGSGCLLITLLAELPEATGVGVDLAEDALRVARQNADLNGVGARASFVQGDCLTGIEGTFDLLVSNPPYIRTGDLAGLETAVRDHDPVLALDGGADGFDIYRRIARDFDRVVPDGWMLFEVGAGMADAACHEMNRLSGQSDHRVWRMWHDFHGHKRCVATKTLNKGLLQKRLETRR